MEFFIDLILDNDMVQDELKAKLAKGFYDMALIVAFRYHSVDNFSVSLDMLKLAAKLLKTHVSQSFKQLLNLRSKRGEFIQPNLFRNPYLIKFFE